MAVTMRVRCSKCDNYQGLVKEPDPANPPKCPHCGSEVTAIDGTPFGKRVEELREATRNREKERAQRKEQMKTPMGLYDLIEKYLDEHGGVTKEPIHSGRLRNRLDLSRSNALALDYAEVERSYKNMRRVLLRLMKKFPDLKWPDMPPVEDHAEDGLVSIQKCCLDADKSAKVTPEVVVIDLKRFNQRQKGSLQLLMDLIGDRPRNGVALDENKHGKGQPKVLRAMLRGAGYDEVASKIKKKVNIVKLHIPIERITTSVPETEKNNPS